MKALAGKTGALAALALMMAMPAGGLQQSGTGLQDPMTPPVPPASQSGMPSTGSSSSKSGRAGIPGMPSLQDDVPPGRTPEEQTRAMNALRQKEIINDTNKLLDLALQLKSDVDKSSKDMLSLDVVKKADEIERLAHSVKEKMRN